MRKLIGIIAAAVLGLVGVGLLASYVKSARDEIRAEEEPVSIYVLTSDVPAGSTVDAVLAASTLTEVPQRLVAAGAVDAVDDVDAALVSESVFHAGEQVLTTRFVAPFELATADVPAGHQQLTLRLDPERAVGGMLRPGASVGIVVSLDRDQVTAPAEGATTDSTPTTAAPSAQMTQVVLQHVLVTNLQFTSTDDAAAAAALLAAASDNEVPFTPTAPVLVTVALTTKQVERIVYAAEFGTVWLTLEGDDVDAAGDSMVAGLDVFTLSGSGR